jgi:hypothetical protein
MQAFQTALLVVGIAVSGTTCGFVIKNFCDTKKQTKAIEQNGANIVALTAKVGKDHKDIMDKLDEDTKAILASDQKILDELKKQTPPKGGKAAPKKVDGSQNDDESVQSENTQEDPLVKVVRNGLRKLVNQTDENQRKTAEVTEKAQAELEDLEKKKEADFDRLADGLVKNIREQIDQGGEEA